jgi:hypothetical protein
MSSLLKHRVFALIAGLITAGVIIFSQLFYFQAATYCQKKVESTQHEEKAADHKSYISIPSSTIASVQGIELNQDLSFVLEILVDKEEDSNTHSIHVPIHSRYLQTLFRFIIAPNAP